MPIKKASAKALRQTHKRRAHNLVVKSGLKKLKIRFRKALTTKQSETAANIVREYIRALDKAAKVGVIHRNAAARKKSRLHAALKKAAVKT